MRELIEYNGIYFIVEEFNNHFCVIVDDEIYTFNDYNSVNEFIQYYENWGF